MSEKGLVELPVLSWMCGEPGDGYGGKGLGWTYRDEKTLAPFGRPLEDPLVEDLLVAAIQRINPVVKTNAQAQLAVNALRKVMAHPDKLTANRQTLDLLRDGAKIALEPGEDTQTVRFIEFDPTAQDRNDFCATNQYRVQGARECREDTVLLVNGIPLVIAEYKSYLASGKDWKEAVHQLHRYAKAQQDELIDYFKLTPREWEKWNHDQHGENRPAWRPPLKILIVCDRLLTGFDAPVEQVMYLDKPLRDHNLLQAIARTNRPLPSMKKLTGVVVDYFGVLRAHANTTDEATLADCARRMVAHLRAHHCLTAGWSQSKGGTKLVEETLLAESWNPAYAALGFDAESAEPAFLKPAVDELAKADTFA